MSLYLRINVTESDVDVPPCFKIDLHPPLTGSDDFKENCDINS